MSNDVLHEPTLFVGIVLSLVIATAVAEVSTAGDEILRFFGIFVAVSLVGAATAAVFAVAIATLANWRRRPK